METHCAWQSNWNQQQRQGTKHPSTILSLSLAGELTTERITGFSTFHKVQWRYLGDQAKTISTAAKIAHMSLDRCNFDLFQRYPNPIPLFHDLKSHICVVCCFPHHHFVGCYECEPTIFCPIVFLIFFVLCSFNHATSESCSNFFFPFFSPLIFQLG